MDFEHCIIWNLVSSSSSSEAAFFFFFFLSLASSSEPLSSDFLSSVLLIYLWYTPLSNCPLLLNSYCLSTSLQRRLNLKTNCLSNIIGLILFLNISKSSLYVELKGARIIDFSDAFLRVLYTESMLCSVKQSMGSSFSFLLYRLGSLYVYSFLIISLSVSLKSWRVSS